MKIKLLFLVLLLAHGGSLRAEEPARRFREELAAKSRGIHTIVCRFGQIRRSAVLQEDVHREGQFHYKRPERLRLLFSDGDCIVMNGADFLIVNSGRKTVMKMQSNPMLRELQRIMSACMTADLEQLTAGFVSELTESATRYELSLMPRRKNRLERIVLVFSKEDMSLDAMQMVETSGDYILYNFSDKRFNEPVDDGVFEIAE